MSSLAWLDFSESDRQKALDVIDLFREKGTVDELGIGTIRDAIADQLFPGTSTIMTRARYYLFVPWMYQAREVKKVASSEIARVARADELGLLNELAQSADKAGVIGIEAREKLRRLPSTIYWAGLERLGIRKVPGSIDGYHRSLDAFYRNRGTVVKGDEALAVSGARHNWDRQLPSQPTGFPKGATLQLREREADYLRERILQSAPESLFAFLAMQRDDIADITFPWEHPLRGNMTAKIQAELDHAQCFSEVMFGAALLYNLMLSEKTENATLVADYQGAFDEWAELMTSRANAFAAWSREDFWTLVHSTGARVPLKTERFINAWLTLAINSEPETLASLPAAQNLVCWRERELKGPLARLDNARARDLWRGASGRYRLDYRWNRPVKRILSDMHSAVADS